MLSALVANSGLMIGMSVILRGISAVPTSSETVSTVCSNPMVITAGGKEQG